MKSKFFGLSAKLALAILAVGTTMTSCYDSENVDIVAPNPVEPAKYVIAGNLTDGTTGMAIDPTVTNVEVTIGGASVTVDANGYFEQDGLNPGAHVVEVKAEGYYDAKRTIYLQEVGDGGISYGNADFVLYGPEAGVTLPDSDVPASDAQGNVILDQEKANLLAVFENLGIDTETVELKVENGKTILTAPAETNTAVGESLTVTLPYYGGFASTVALEADDIFTKSITDGQIWNASAEALLNLPYGLVQGTGTREYTITCGGNESIISYTLTIVFENRTLSFEGAEGTVMYQSSWSVDPEYDSHDNHDSHDSHNNHGDGNGAGGGNSNMGY